MLNPYNNPTKQMAIIMSILNLKKLGPGGRRAMTGTPG